MAEARARPGLDVPREAARRGVRRPVYNAEAFGAWSERVARFLGTGRFLVYMTVFIALWIGWNNVAPDRWQFDPYTHTFLTLILSLQASYAAPLILLAQNRQLDRDRVQWEQDRGRSERMIADTEYLTRELAALRIAIGEVATRDFLRSELRDLLEERDPEERRAGKGKDKRAKRKDRAKGEDAGDRTEAAVDDAGSQARDVEEDPGPSDDERQDPAAHRAPEAESA